MTPLLAILPLLAHVALLAEAGPVIVQRASTSTAAAASTTSRASGDLQTYNSGLGAIFAPAVTKSGNYWYSSGQQYNFLVEALDGSCYKQMDQCQLKANQQGNTPFAVSDCNGWQIQACRSSGSGSGSSSSSSSSSSSTSSAAASKSSSTASSSSASTSAASSSSSSAAAKSSSSTSSSSSSSSAARASSSSSTSSSASASSATPTAAPSAVAAGNYQTFTGAAGGIAAPAVTQSGSKWYQSGSSYDSIYYALQQSCYAQASSCSSSSASFDKNVCWGTQVNDCLTNAQKASDSYSSSAAAYSSSVASANFAAATQARTVPGDLQTFTGALGGIAAPAVTGTQYNWKVAGRSDNFYNLIDALSASCYDQQGAVGAKGAAANWAYELTTDNIYNVQINNCLTNARNVANNWSPNSSTTVTTSTSTSASSSAAASPTSTVVAATSTTSSKAAASSSSSASSAAASSSSAASSKASSSSAAATSMSSDGGAAAAAASSLAAAASASAASASSAAASASSAAAAAASSAAAALKAPAGWSAPSAACIAEGSRGRALTGASLASSDMTYQKCADFCDSKGFAIFGIEYSQECYCGANLANGASLTLPSTNCNMKCGGSGAICGGPSALTIFVKDSVLSGGSLSSDLTAVKVTLPDGWAAASSTCVQEGSTGRALAGASYYDDNMTIGKCLAFCKTKGMQWAGIEYSRECFCGNDLVNGASLDRTGTCDMTCPGQPGSICGGPSLLSLFKDSSLLYSLTQIGSWSKQGCIQEVGGRALNGASLVTNDMTLEKCTSFCANKGFAFAGLEYATECYCGNTLANGATLSAFSTQCNMPCGGATGQICGGPNAITLYSTLSGNALVGA